MAAVLLINKMIKLLTILLLLTVQVKANKIFSFGNLYYFKIESKGTSMVDKLFTNDSAALQQPDKTIAQYFEGWLQIKAFSKSDRLTFYTAAITIKKYNLLNEDHEVLELPFEQVLLEKPFYFQQLHNDNITQFYFEKNVLPAAQKIIKELLVHFQFKHKEEGKKVWMSAEQTTLAPCKVAYQLSNTNALSTTITRNVYFIGNEVYSKGEDITTRYTPTGRTTIQYSNVDKKLISVKGIEKITTFLNKKTAGVLEQTIYITDSVNGSLKDKCTVENYAGYYAIKDSLIITNLYTTISSQQFLSEVRKQTLADDTFKSLVTKLHAQNRNDDSLYLKLRALCTIHPQNSYLLMPLLDTADANSKLYTTIWSAVLHAENDESVNALSSILLHHTNDWPWLKYIIGNMGLAKNVTDSVIIVFKQLYATSSSLLVKNTIELALGSMVDNLYIKEPQKSKDLYLWLLQILLAKEKNVQNTIQQILVLGNTNNKNSYLMLQQYLLSTNKEINLLAKQIMSIIRFTTHN
jgi:hypothetical protein